MRGSTINEWQALADGDAEKWGAEIRAQLDACAAQTGRSVISASLADTLDPGVGPLAGVPFAVKELFDVKGVPTHSSSMLPELLAQPAAEQSELVDYLATLGGSCVAKAQMNEFAYGLSGENLHYGDCPHPRLAGCLSGGSSSGSAHLVAGGYLPLAFGTDTGGSIRLPAAWCGLYGIRWSPGFFMKGGFPLAPSFDALGWFTRTPGEMGQVLRAWFAVGDEEAPVEPKGGCLLPRELLLAETAEALQAAIAGLGLSSGAAEAELGSRLGDCQKAFNVLQSREAYAIHREWLAAYPELYDPAVKQRIERALTWTPAEVEEATAVRAWVQQWFADYFETQDYLVMPVCPGASIPPAKATPELRENTLRLTSPASLAQRPALTVPVWLDDQRSVGLQFIFKDTAPEVPLALLSSCRLS